MRCAWALCLLASACGRFDFSAHGGDGGVGDAADGSVAGDAIDAPVDAPVDVIVSSLCPNAIVVGPGSVPSLAWNGSTYGVFYTNGGNAWFDSISKAGAAGTPAMVGTGSAFTTSLIASGATFYGAWDNSTNVQTVEVSAAGAVLAGPVNIGSGGSPRFASGGGSLQLVWDGYVNKLQIFTTGLAADLTGAAPLQLTNTSYDSGYPNATWTGTDWTIVFDGSKLKMSCVDHGLYYQQIKSNGMAAGNASESYSFVCDNSGNAEGHAMVPVWNGADVSIAWSGIASDPSHIYIARMDAATGALVTTPVVATSSASRSPSMVWNGSELGLAWTGNGVFVTRATSSGASTAEVTMSMSGSSPSIAWDGTGFGVAWVDAGMIYFARTCN